MYTGERSRAALRRDHAEREATTSRRRSPDHPEDAGDTRHEHRRRRNVSALWPALTHGSLHRRELRSPVRRGSRGLSGRRPDRPVTGRLDGVLDRGRSLAPEVLGGRKHRKARLVDPELDGPGPASPRPYWNQVLGGPKPIAREAQDVACLSGLGLRRVVPAVGFHRICRCFCASRGKSILR